MDKDDKNVTFNVENINNNIKRQYKEGSPFKYKNKLKDNYNNDILSSPKIYLEIKEELSKKRANIDIDYFFEVEEEDIKDIYDIIKRQNKNNKINNNLLSLLKKTKINEFLKSDLLFTGLEIDNLINYMNTFICLNKYSLNEFIYSYKEPAENIYLILKGRVVLYKFVETQEMFSCEEYYLYLNNVYMLYKQLISKNDNIKNNIASIKDINEFIDIDYLINDVNKNKNIFPLYSMDDIPELNKIILLLKLFIQFLENKKGKIPELYKQYNIPIDYLNCDKLLKKQITINNYMDEISRNIKEREKFYMKYIGKEEKYKVYISKFVKDKNLKEDNYFGNFEIIDTKPIRKDYALSESESTILLSINKKEYSKIVNKTQKEIRKKEINFLHDNFFFKTINRQYFESKIFIKFEIDQFFKGYILSNQGEKMNNFIFIEEGIIKSSINDISISELPEKIRELYDFIIKKAKEYDIDHKTLIDFDTKLKKKTNIKYELLKETLEQKKNFTIFKAEKGLIGDYEYFFNTPSFMTSTVISKNNRIFFYDFHNFKKVNNETRAFNESLKKISFYKLKSILKRMISIYNSNFSFSIKMIEDNLANNKLEEKDNNIDLKDEISNLNNSVDDEKNCNPDVNIFRNKKINLNNFISIIKESYNNMYNFERQNNNDKNRLINFVSNTKNNLRTSYNVKSFHLSDDIENLKQKKMTIKTRKINANKTNFDSKESSFKNSNNKTSIKRLKMENEETKMHGENKLKNKLLKKDRILNVIFPPLISNIKEPSQKIFKRNITLNKDRHSIRHTMHTFNSINNTSLGHTDNHNFDKKLLSNYNIKISKKSKSIDIKRAQIIVLKNRDKKAKLLLRKKNYLDNLISEEIFE